MKRGYLLFVMVAWTVFQTYAQEWIVPVESGSVHSPFAFSDSTRKAGSNLFNLNCKSCHGEPGKNNAVKLIPSPPDPSSPQMQNNSDGMLFYKATQGRGTMPAFKNSLTSADVWRIISFIRSFNDNYVQEVAKRLLPGASLEQAKFLCTYNKEKEQIEVLVTSLKENVRLPVAGAEIKLYAKRYFGNLPIDEARITNNQGLALFNYHGNLPGDATGLVHLVVRPSDEAVFGEVKADTAMVIGVLTNRPPLNEQRALWNVVQKTPVWLLLTYILTVLVVWGFIFYVLYQLRILYKSGMETDHDK